MFKKVIASFALALSLVVGSGVTVQTVEASSIEDSVNGSSSSSSSFYGDVTAEDKAIGDWISGRRGMTSENLSNASQTLSPLTNIMGNIVGGLVVLIFSVVFVITGLDLLYIAFPPIRNFLYKGNASAAGGGMMPQGGMMGGMYGHRGMMGGGVVNQGMAAEGRPTQWISDEAVQCVAMLNNGGAPMQAGMVGMQQQQMGATMSMKSVLGTYFKKRLFFMIILAVCAIVLTSSVLLGTGVNLANWITKILSGINNNIPK
jgi:hypothetical protein